MKKSIVLIGGGGHCRSCIDVIESTERYKIEGIIDKKEKLNSKVLGYKIFATDTDLPKVAREYKNFLITIGQIKSATKRILIFKELRKIGAYFPTIISPNAYISNAANVQAGTIVMHHALVNSGVYVGKNCVINSKALLEHGAHIGDHCHVSTAAVINGGVVVGSGTFIGSRAMIREYINVGNNVIISSGLNIMKSVKNNSIIRSGL